MKSFCKDLKQRVTKIINYEKKMITLKIEESKSYHKQKMCYICKINFSIDCDDQKYYKVRDYCHFTGKYRGAGTKYQTKFL